MSQLHNSSLRHQQFQQHLEQHQLQQILIDNTERFKREDAIRDTNNKSDQHPCALCYLFSLVSIIIMIFNIDTIKDLLG